MSSPYHIREILSTDIPFILDSVCRSYYDGSPDASHMRYGLFFRHHHDVMTRLFNKPTTNVLICGLEGDDDLILGYIIWEPATIERAAILHYLYTKGAFRHRGIAKALLIASQMPLMGNSQIITTHWTGLAATILKKKAKDLTYFNPYLLHESNTQEKK